jgi:hypothetical protein
MYIIRHLRESEKHRHYYQNINTMETTFLDRRGRVFD